MNQRYVTSPVTEYLYRKASMAGIPLSGTFELTPTCNMDCKMCYVRMSRQEQEAIRPLRTAKEWLTLAKKAKESGMLYLLLTGGEPFLHPEFREILTGLAEMGFVISINSNGTMIDETVIEWLKEAAPGRINITVYGTSNETYAKLCGNPNGFTQVDRAIKLLKEAGISVKVNCSLTPYNAKELPDIIYYAHSQGLHVQTATYMFPPIRKSMDMVGKNDRFTPEEAAYNMAHLEYLLNDKESFLAREDGFSALLEMEDECMEIGDGVRCRAGRCAFWITWEGKMMSCGMFPSENARNVFEEGFDEVWEAVKKETEAIRLPVKCAGCSIKDQCKTCAAMVVTETGCFDKVPEYRCQMMQAYPSQRRKVENLVKEGLL